MANNVNAKHAVKERVEELVEQKISELLNVQPQNPDTDHFKTIHLRGQIAALKDVLTFIEEL